VNYGTVMSISTANRRLHDLREELAELQAALSEKECVCTYGTSAGEKMLAAAGVSSIKMMILDLRSEIMRLKERKLELQEERKGAST
jgi:uncharacterized small protein (DUF1192 family)